MKKTKNGQGDPFLTKLVQIKRLLMLGLMKTGATQNEVAKALGVSQGTVSVMCAGAGGRRRRPK